MTQQTPDLSHVPNDKKDIINMAFSLSIHVLRAFYMELLDNIKNHPNINDIKGRLDELMPVLEPGGFRVVLNGSEYSLKFQQCKSDYDLNKEINKIPNLGKMDESDKQKFIREIDIAASSVPCVHSKYMTRDDFKLLLKDIFDIFDREFSLEKADKLKDLSLKVNEHQRTYQIIDPDGIRFGLHVNKL